MGKEKGVCGVGVCDSGRHAASVGTVPTHGYRLWQRMLQRCYDERYLNRRPTYRGCSVHNDFVRFQSFMDWATVQAGYGLDGWALDKDLLVLGNKVYGPKTCVFVPRKINQVINLVVGKRSDLPVGVFQDKRYTNYYSMLKLGEENKLTRLGTFDTVEEAFAAYKEAKEGKVKRLANEFKDQIDARAYEALMKYEVNIND